MNHKRMPRGFTLIELLAVVLIVGVLAAVAYPSYREYVARSRRAQVQAVLVRAQQWMERFYTENFSYEKNSANTSVTDASQFPSQFSVSPPSGEGSPVYDISLTDVKSNSYTVKATRKAGSAMANDRCGDFSVDYLGRKKLENYATTTYTTMAAALEACWK